MEFSQMMKNHVILNLFQEGCFGISEHPHLVKGGDGLAIEMKSPKPCPGFW
jgi:hypothetical protein